jgi:hypothetical protein
VLRAYSVGIANPVIKRDPSGKAPGGIVCGGEMAEVSLVDRPANKNCELVLAKSAGSQTPWTYGDLEGLLAKAEAAEAEATADLVKDKKGKKKGQGPDDGLVDPTVDAGSPDDDSAPGSDADVDTDHDNDDWPDDDGSDGDADTKAYTAAVELHKSAEPKRDGVPLSGTEYLQKAAAWQRWSELGDEQGLDGTATGYARWLEKRDFDANVGGGVDRDKIPAQDFVDSEGRRFPIVKPGDVSDAVSSYGRAKPQIPMPQFKERLTAIAHRKGPAFVAELPDSWSDSSSANKDITLTSPDPAGLVPYNLQGQEDVEAVNKGSKDCPNCGKSYDADAKLRRCENCGAKLPKAKVGKTLNAALPSDVKPAGPHREPDGSQVELLEHETGMHTTPDHDAADVIPASVKSAEAYIVKRTHDAFCPAYSQAVVEDAYPSLKTVAGVVDAAWWSNQIPDAVAKADMRSVALLAAVADGMTTLAGIDPTILADASAAAHKAFTDDYPTAKLHPDTVTPGQFQRPYITAGHAAPNASHGVPNTPPPPSTPLNPDDYHRPLITAGHEAASPSDKGNNLATSTVRTGAGRTFYTSAAREAAKNAMGSMHDHIATTFPDMCPLAPSRPVLPADMHDKATPVPVAPLRVPAAPGEKAATPDVEKAGAQRYRHGWIPIGVGTPVVHRETGRTGTVVSSRKTKVGGVRHKVRMDDKLGSHETFDEESLSPHGGPANRGGKKRVRKDELAAIVKSAVADATANISRHYEATIADLQAQVDELGSQPDPAQAPLRGVVRKAAGGDAAPVEKRSLAAEAQQQAAALERAEQIHYLQLMSKSADPNTREHAETMLEGLLTKSA